MIVADTNKLLLSCSEFAFTHKSCVYTQKTFVGHANTGPVASLGQTELSLTQMKSNRRKYRRNKLPNCTKKKSYLPGLNFKLMQLKKRKVNKLE